MASTMNTLNGCHHVRINLTAQSLSVNVERIHFVDNKYYGVLCVCVEQLLLLIERIFHS